MKHYSIFLLVICTAILASTACLIGFMMGRRPKRSNKHLNYPVPEETGPGLSENILEEEDAIYDAGNKKAEELLARFKTLMAEKKPYLDSKVSIEAVAATLGTNKTTLSKMINEKFRMNFRQLLNSYRVKEALMLFSIDPDLTMEELRRASGFNSVSTFTSSFSRFTGCTPGEYCKKVARR